MALFEMSELVGTRVRFQRFADSKIFNGWVRSFDRGSFILLVENVGELAPADRFVFNVSADQTGVCFLGDFVHAIGVDEPGQAANQGLCQFNLIGKVDYRPSAEEARHRIEKCVVRLTLESGKEAQALLHDVSANGAGIMTQAKLNSGQTVTLHVDVSGRTISLKAEVRHVTPSTTVPGTNKVGLKILNAGRLEGALWRTLPTAA